ncbi:MULTISPECIES: AraC family transcriptional regulator [Metabacillus]|uniref:Transcriptional regulator n=2 Tax=Metabacillus TaxID=2675233 RepID=A0A179T5I7_9BACI|nr:MULTISPECIES: AraC family transcriptional regulator [Metabacillus]OAS89265.1 transcriptional regulator [Metabacillus litoralis]QNF28779.1 helix-turn-helix transcriptional regulator [Metabacillus sp. KUDC1714]
MNINNLLSGKTSLNKYVHHLSFNEVAFHVHYWGVMPNHYNTLLHKHSFFEVCFVVDGEGEYIDNNSTYKLQKNTLFLSRPNVLHQIKSEDGLFLLYIGLELIESESNDKWLKIMEQIEECTEIIIDVEERASFSLLWESLLSQASQNDHPFFEEILMNIANSLILSLLERFSPMDADSSNQNISNEETSPILMQAKLYIQDNLSDTLKLSDIAKHLHISSRHLSRLFVKELGVSYSEYVKKERIQKSAMLLKTTNLSIKEISEQTGFKNVHYFTRVFSATVRNPPGNFRTLYTNQEKKTYSEKEKPSLQE